jgi:cephalosporin hydroxylase
MSLLDNLAIKYGSDKSSKGHGYTKYYAKHLDPMRLNNLKVLELGVRQGWSMHMWHDYFENGQICGIDNNEEGLCPDGFDEERIAFETGSQDDDAFLAGVHEAHGPFDVIVDDCSHISPLTIRSFEILFPKLKRGGLYIIEDLHVCDYNKHYLPHGPSALAFINNLNRDIESKIVYQNKIAFIKKCL